MLRRLGTTYLLQQKLPKPHVLERSVITNRHGLKLRRFTIRAQRPKAACVLMPPSESIESIVLALIS